MRKSGATLAKEVIDRFENRQAALAAERELIRTSKSNHLCRNGSHRNPNGAQLLSVIVPLTLYKKGEEKAKAKGFENISQFVRSLLRQATK